MVPRIWSDTRRQGREASAGSRIDSLAARIRKGLDAWLASVDELARWLRYVPTSAQGSPRRRGRSAGGHDTGPETTH